MSTRGAIGFRYKGKDYITYNHSDSYPSWMGKHLVEDTIPKLLAMPDLLARVEALELISGKNEEKPLTKKQLERCTAAGTVNTQVGGKSEKVTAYQALRETQGDLDKNLEVGLMIDSSSFLKDSLFCEWAYVINLDEMVLEVYQGFQRSAHDKGRYGAAVIEQNAKEALAGDKQPEYFPVALVGTFPIKKRMALGEILALEKRE